MEPIAAASVATRRWLTRHVIGGSEARMREKIRVVLVEALGQLGYVPIAAAYLVAYACHDPIIKEAFSFTCNTRHFHGASQLVRRRRYARRRPG